MNTSQQPMQDFLRGKNHNVIIKIILTLTNYSVLKAFQKKIVLAGVLILFCIVAVNGRKSKVTTQMGTNGMKVEGQSGWMVTDEPLLRLSWEPVGEVSGKPVAGYEVIAASEASLAQKGEGDFWCSGFLPIKNGPWVLFDASGLPSRTEVWWRVRPVCSKTGFGQWSAIASFETGLKNEDDWQGKWIGMNPQAREQSAPQFRKSFDITKPVNKARL